MIDKLVMWFAWRLPRRLVYWAGIRLWAHATTGPWSHEEAPAVRASELFQRW